MGEALLALDGVGKAFRRGRRRWQVLRDVSLTIARGEIVGVVGARGEGKTTLLEIAAGIELPDQGTVWFESRDLARYAAEGRTDLLGARIAWMDRDGAGDFEVLDYVGLPLAMGRGGRMRDADDRAMAALERAGARDTATKRWGELSNWERVLVAFARGFAGRPSLMVVDDLLDGLGPRGTRQAGELLLSLAKELECGVLVSASDLEPLLVAHRVLCFENGTLAVMSQPTGSTNVVDMHGAARHAVRGEPAA